MSAASVVTAYNAEGQILLGRRRDDGKWTCPAGHANPGESPSETALREFKEETGLVPESLSPLTIDVLEDGTVIHFFSAFVTGEPHSNDDPDNEVEEWKFFATDDLPSNLHGPKDFQNILHRLFTKEGELEKSEPSESNHHLPSELEGRGWKLHVDGPDRDGHVKVEAHHPYAGKQGHLNGTLRGDQLHLFHTEVQPLYRRKGIGRAMFSALYEHAKKHGVTTAHFPEHSTDANHVLARLHSDYHPKERPDAGPRQGAYDYRYQPTQVALGDLGKGEDLEKGSAQRRLPFNPIGLAPSAENSMAGWQGVSNRTQEHRQTIPYMGGPERTRALMRLTPTTPTRRGPDGKIQFLLHRGVGPVERAAISGVPGKVVHTTASSWTPRYGLARLFANAYGPRGATDDTTNSHVMSAWIHQDAIHAIPKMYGELDPNGWRNADEPKSRGANQHRGEHEVIVAPHSSDIAKPHEIVVPGKDGARKDLDGLINDRGPKGVNATFHHATGALKRGEEDRGTLPPMSKAEDDPPPTLGKAISSLPPGKALPKPNYPPSIWSNTNSKGKAFSDSYDYSHLLPKGQEHMRLLVHHQGFESPGKIDEEKFRATLHDPRKENEFKDEKIGSVTAYVRPPMLKLPQAIEPHSDLYRKYHGKGLGQAMYEAAYAHAHQAGITHVRGGIHSNDAHALHKRLAAKHGFAYAPATHDPDPSNEYPHGLYDYAIKEELSPEYMSDDLLIGPHRCIVFERHQLGKSEPEDLAKTDSPEFHDWFNGSHVKTPDNKPLRVYHGTSRDQDFRTFKIGPRGAWFTSDPVVASSYAAQNDSQTHKMDHNGKYQPVNQSPRVIPAYLSLKNPYHITPADHQRHNVEGYGRAQAQHFRELQGKGHDGVVFPAGPDGHKTFVVFSPNQIKGAFNAKPTQHKDMSKEEWDSPPLTKSADEIHRLLDHPDPTERSMALKLKGVTPGHLQNAALDEDPVVHQVAISHPRFDTHAAMRLLEAEKGRDGNYPLTQKLAYLARPGGVEPHEVTAAVRAAENAPSGPQEALHAALVAHPNLSSDEAARMFEDHQVSHSNRVRLMAHPNIPPDILHEAVRNGLLTPGEGPAEIARAALQHPSLPADLLEGTARLGMDSRFPHVHQLAQHALSVGQVPEKLINDLITRARSSPTEQHLALAGAALRGPASHPGHVDELLRMRDPAALKHVLGARGLLPRHLDTINQYLNPGPLAKATKPEEYKAITRAIDPEAHKLVDHLPDLSAHPPSLGPQVEAYRTQVLDSKLPVRKIRGSSGGQDGVTKKLAYFIQPKGAPEPTRCIVKPYHERIVRAIKSWMKFPVQGWAEMTHQGLYHAGDIGHLHSKVHVSEHNMGPGREHEPALVVHTEPDMVHQAETDEAHPQTHDDVRRIAMMDFLTNNLDRHGGNLMQHESGESVLAIDHGRSFQYLAPKTGRARWLPLSKRNRSEHFDEFGPYHKDSSLQGACPFSSAPPPSNPWASAPDSPGPDGDWEAGAEGRRAAKEKQTSDYSRTFEWWKEASPKVRAEMTSRLQHIKDPEVRAHIARNFNARADWLDERAENGLENYGDNWHWDAPVPIYQPGQITQDEEDDLGSKRNHELYEKEQAKRGNRGDLTKALVKLTDYVKLNR